MKPLLAVSLLAALGGVAHADDATEDRDTDATPTELPWFMPKHVAAETRPLPSATKPADMKGFGARIIYASLSGDLSGSLTGIVATADLPYESFFVGLSSPSLTATGVPNGMTGAAERSVLNDSTGVLVGFGFLDLYGRRVWSGQAGGKLCNVSIATPSITALFGISKTGLEAGGRFSPIGITIQSCKGVLAQLRLDYSYYDGVARLPDPTGSGGDVDVEGAGSGFGLTLVIDYLSPK